MKPGAWAGLTPTDVKRLRAALKTHEARQALARYGLTLEQAGRLREPKTCVCGRLVGRLPVRDDPARCTQCQGEDE